MPRSGRSGRRSPCLRDVDPRDNSTASRQIPFPIILIAGCGDVGAALGAGLATGGHEVWGLRRDPAGLPAAIRPLRADLTRPTTLIGLPRAIDIVVYTAAPDESTDRAYRATYVEGLMRAPPGPGGSNAGAASDRLHLQHRRLRTDRRELSRRDLADRARGLPRPPPPPGRASPRGLGALGDRRALGGSTTRAGRRSSTVSGAGRPPARRAPRGTATGSTATTASGRSVTSSSSPDQRRSERSDTDHKPLWRTDS